LIERIADLLVGKPSGESQAPFGKWLVERGLR